MDWWKFVCSKIKRCFNCYKSCCYTYCKTQRNSSRLSADHVFYVFLQSHWICNKLCNDIGNFLCGQRFKIWSMLRFCCNVVHRSSCGFDCCFLAQITRCLGLLYCKSWWIAESACRICPFCNRQLTDFQPEMVVRNRKNCYTFPIKTLEGEMKKWS